MPRPLLDAIIAVHDPRRPLARCVRSLLDQRDQLAAAGAELRVNVVVHNLDIEPIEGALGAGLAPRVRLLQELDGIRSPAGPFNRGLAEAEGEWVTTIGSDDLLEPGALAAWFTRGQAARADAVIASLRTPEGIVTTPYLRSRRRLLLDPVRDRLAYRTAPLGLLRRTSLERIGFTYTAGGHLNGEDIEPGLRLWFRGGRITYPYGAPCYQVTDDMGASRATAALGPLGREVGFLAPLLAQDWLAHARPAEREAIAVKLARAQLRGAIQRRIEAREWDGNDARVAREAWEGLRALSGNDLAALAATENALLEEAGRASDPEELTAAARSIFAQPRARRVLPRSPRAALRRDARPRMFVSQQLAQRSGAFSHPDAPSSI